MEYRIVTEVYWPDKKTTQKEALERFSDFLQSLQQAFPKFFETLYTIKDVPGKETSIIKRINISRKNLYKEGKVKGYHLEGV